MYGLFYSLVLSLIYGQWTYRDTSSALGDLRDVFVMVSKALGSLLRNIGFKIPDNLDLADSKTLIIFMDQNITDDTLLLGQQAPRLIASVIALIITITIIMFTIKGIKKVFSVFFMGLR